MTQILTSLSLSHAVQGIIVGAVLGFLTANVLMSAAMRSMTTTVNGWSTTSKAGQGGNGTAHAARPGMRDAGRGRKAAAR